MSNINTKLLISCVIIFVFTLKVSVLSQKYFFVKYNTQLGLISSNITDITQDDDGYLWIATKNGLSKFNGKSFENFNVINGLVENHIDKLEIVNNQIYAFHNNEDISIIKNKKNITNKKISNKQKKSVLVDYFQKKLGDEIKINSVIEKNNYTSVSTQSGLYLYEKNSINQYELILHLNEENGLESENITCSFVDQESILWIGTSNNGLFSLTLDYFNLYPWTGTFISKYQINENEYYLTFENSIVRLNIIDGKPKLEQIHKFDKKINTAYFSESELWYGTDNGLFINFIGTNIVYNFPELDNKKITSLSKINNELLISTNNSVYRYNTKLDKFEKIFSDTKFEIDRLETKSTKIFLFGKGNVYEYQNNKFVKLIVNQDNKEKSIKFGDLYVDELQNYWICTEGRGVYHYNTKNNSVYNYSDSNNIKQKIIKSVIKKNNKIYFTTQFGILEYNQDTKRQILFSEKYFQDIEFYFGSIDYNNNQYILTNKGLVSVIRNDIKINRKINNINTEFYSSGTLLIDYNKLISKNNKLTFPIEIKFDMVSLKNEIYYRTYLEGFDKEWSKLSDKNYVRYSDLKAGEYNLKIQAYDPNNNKLLNEKKIKFIVYVPFYKRIEAKILLAFLILGLIFIILLVRSKILKDRQKKLQELVENRTFELSNQNKYIEQFSYSLTHDLKNPVSNIKGLIDIFNSTTDLNQMQQIKEMLLENADLLDEKIKSTINTIKKVKKSKEYIEKVYFNDVLSKVKVSLMLLIRKNNATLKADFNVKSIIYNESVIESILYNLISNAIKYSKENVDPFVLITTRKKDNIIELKISDNGIGIDLIKQKEGIFSIFHRQAEDKDGAGLGLYIVKQMVEVNGGSIEVESKPNLGTSFIIKLISK